MQKRTEQDPVPRIFFILQTRFRICFGKHPYEYMLRKISLQKYASENIPAGICSGKTSLRTFASENIPAEISFRKHPCGHMLRKTSLRVYASESIPTSICFGKYPCRNMLQKTSLRVSFPGTQPHGHMFREHIPAGTVAPDANRFCRLVSVRKNRP